MELLRLVHGYQFNSAAALLFPTPYALVCLVLFIWSLVPAFRGQVRVGFLAWLRLTWLLTLFPAITGVAMAVGGHKVPSAVALATGKTKYGLAPDPSRDLEHWMYAGFCLLSLYVIELLVKNKTENAPKLLRLLPIATLFLYGCAYMVARVAVFPGTGK